MGFNTNTKGWSGHCLFTSAAQEIASPTQTQNIGGNIVNVQSSQSDGDWVLRAVGGDCYVGFTANVTTSTGILVKSSDTAPTYLHYLNSIWVVGASYDSSSSASGGGGEVLGTLTWAFLGN